MPSEDEKFRELAEHYRDTFALTRDYLKQRDRYFALALAVVIAMLMQIAAPGASDRLISAVIGRGLGAGAIEDRTFVGTVAWLLLFAFAFRYFQLVVLVNRQYKYIHLLERALTSEYDGVLFTREGRWYLDRYPAFANWAHFVYRMVFPALMFIVATAKICTEVAQAWAAGCCLIPHLLLNIAIYVGVVASLLLYVRLFQVVRQLRLTMAAVRAVVLSRHVDEAVRREEEVVGRLDRTEVGTVADGAVDER